MPWTLDTNHLEVAFSAKHLMVSTVRGHFDTVEASIHLDEEHPEQSHVTARIRTDSLNTGAPDRDAHLKSADFFDVERYPEVRFESTRVERKGDRLELHGDLTIRDVTREIALDVEYAGQSKSPWGTINAGFTASAKLNRKDWNLNWNAALETGGWLVGDEVKVEIEIEFVKQPEPAAAVPA